MNLMLKTAKVLGLVKPAGKPQTRCAWVIDRKTGRPVRAWTQAGDDEGSSLERPEGPRFRAGAWRRRAAA